MKGGRGVEGGVRRRVSVANNRHGKHHRIHIAIQNFLGSFAIARIMLYSNIPVYIAKKLT